MTERLHFHFSLSCIGEGNGNPLQCSCLENPRDGGAWWAAACGVAQSRTRLKWFSSSSSIILLSYFFGFRKRGAKWWVNSSSKRKQNTAGIFWGWIYESKARFQILKEAVLWPVTFLALTRLEYSTHLGASSATKVFIFPTHNSPMLCRRVWVLLQCRGEAERRNSSLFCPTKLVPQWIFSL